MHVLVASSLWVPVWLQQARHLRRQVPAESGNVVFKLEMIDFGSFGLVSK